MFVRKRLFAVSMAAVIAGAALCACSEPVSNEGDQAKELEVQENAQVTEENDASAEDSGETAEVVKTPVEEEKAETTEEPEEVTEPSEDASESEDSEVKTVVDVLLEGTTVESVTWNNGEGEYDFSGQTETEITFHMSDGTEQVMNTNYNPMITGMEMADIDNDGNDEFIINAYFGNTAGDHEYIYAYKLVEGQVVQLYPTKDIPELAAETAWPELTAGDLTNTSIITVVKDGKTMKALDVSIIGKGFEGEEILVQETYHATLIYNEDHWEEFNQ